LEAGEAVSLLDFEPKGLVAVREQAYEASHSLFCWCRTVRHLVAADPCAYEIEWLGSGHETADYM